MNSGIFLMVKSNLMQFNEFHSIKKVWDGDFRLEKLEYLHPCALTFLVFTLFCYFCPLYQSETNTTSHRTLIESSGSPD